MIEWKQIACVIDREGGGWAKYERYVDGVREEKEEPWGSPPREGKRMSEMVTRDDFERNLDKLLDDYYDNPRVETVRLYLTQIHAELDALRAERRECPECSVVCADCGCTWRDHHAIDAVLECGNCGHRPCGGAFSSPKTEAALGAQEGSGDGE
jgi:hypothetical protein